MILSCLKMVSSMIPSFQEPLSLSHRSLSSRSLEDSKTRASVVYWCLIHEGRTLLFLNAATGYSVNEAPDASDTSETLGHFLAIFR